MKFFIFKHGEQCKEILKESTNFLHHIWIFSLKFSKPLPPLYLYELDNDDNFASLALRERKSFSCARKQTKIKINASWIWKLKPPSSKRKFNFFLSLILESAFNFEMLSSGMGDESYGKIYKNQMRLLLWQKNDNKKYLRKKIHLQAFFKYRVKNLNYECED